MEVVDGDEGTGGLDGSVWIVRGGIRLIVGVEVTMDETVGVGCAGEVGGAVTKGSVAGGSMTGHDAADGGESSSGEAVRAVTWRSGMRGSITIQDGTGSGVAISAEGGVGADSGVSVGVGVGVGVVVLAEVRSKIGVGSDGVAIGTAGVEELVNEYGE